VELAEKIDNEMSAFTLAQSDKSLSDIDTLKLILKSLRTISILGVHIENEGIDSDIVYPLIGRHGLGLYEKSIYDFVESKSIPEWGKKGNALIVTIMNTLTFNVNNVRAVQKWSNQQRNFLVEKQIENGHIKFGEVKKSEENE
jgi:Fe-S cluster biosynthesis and repair protein YggX